MRTNELMLYKNMDYGDILSDMTFLMENHGNDYYNTEAYLSDIPSCERRERI